MNQVAQEVRNFLHSQPLPSEAQLTDFFNNLHPASLKPSHCFHRTDLASLTEPTIVSAHLMVQDVRDTYYYVSMAIKRGYDKDSPIFLYKYGSTPEDEPQDIQDHQDYIHVLTDRYPVVCTPIRYQTPWADSLEGNKNPMATVVMEVDGRADYRLGEILNVVALYDPHMQKLFFVRMMTAEEVQQEGLEIVAALTSSDVNAEEGRHAFMNYMCNYASESFSEYLLLTLLSDGPMFLGCEANITPLLVEIFPRVAHIKLVHPCKESLFPYKNQDGELQLTPMQLSLLRTFVVLDLSQFSTQQKVVLKDTELENFSALKMFVEESKAVYRWEIGESHVQHKHIGVVVKAAQLLNPDFNPKAQCISPDLSLAHTLPETVKTTIRHYLQQVMAIDPKLDEEQRKLVEKELAEQSEKNKLAGSLGNIMRLSKLLARSHGRNDITLEDFRRSRDLLELHQPLK